MKPETKKSISDGIFNVVFFVPAVIAAKLGALVYVAAFPFLNFKRMAREEGVLFALFMTVLYLPAIALVAVIVLALVGKIPLY